MTAQTKSRTKPKSALRKTAKPESRRLSVREIREMKELERRLPTALN